MGVFRRLIKFIKDLPHNSAPSFASLFFVLPYCGVQWQCRVHLRVHKKNLQVFKSFCWCKMWWIICATGRCCSEI